MSAVLTDPKKWLRVYTPAPQAPRLVCLPHAGGSANAYLALSRALAPRVEVVAIQYPGRLDRFSEPGITSIEELADHVVEAIGGSTRRTAVFGHSMGALVAFEVVRRRAVERLFVSGAAPPPKFELSERLRREGGPTDDDLLAEVRSLGGTQGVLLDDPDIVELILPALRDDYRALARYAPAEQQIDVPISVLIGDADPRVNRETARGWAQATTKGTDHTVFAGGHFYLTEHIAEIARIIEERLAQ